MLNEQACLLKYVWYNRASNNEKNKAFEINEQSC